MRQVFTYHTEEVQTITKQGVVRGYRLDDISIFKGIPYARARRFHAPEPIKRWEGVLDATSYGCVCPLLELGKPHGELLVPHRYWVMDEDCQNLNVWTPGCDADMRPVMVWLHGGGFRDGSAIEQVAYEGENMSREGDVVVVTVNHRLNVLGFCDLSDFGEEYANSGNAGMDDIIMALRWVRENITSFGGDPYNVTVFGQSGGGAKVTTLLQMPAADGLYNKGINMSGIIGPVLADSKGSGKDLVNAMMAELAVSNVKELETVPYSALAAAYKKVSPALQKEGKYVGGTPHPNAFYRGVPEENGFRSETAHIPMLIGTVFGEFTSFVPAAVCDKYKVTNGEGEEIVRRKIGEEKAAELLPLFKKAYPERNPVDLLNLDFIFRLPTQNYIRLRSALNNCTYSYLFNFDMHVDNGRTPWHCSDIPFVFHNTSLVPSSQWGDATEELEKKIFECVRSFAWMGDPNHTGIPEWPVSKPGQEQTIIFDEKVRVRCNFDAELIPLLAKHMASLFVKEDGERKNILH